MDDEEKDVAITQKSVSTLTQRSDHTAAHSKIRSHAALTPSAHLTWPSLVSALSSARLIAYPVLQPPPLFLSPSPSPPSTPSPVCWRSASSSSPSSTASTPRSSTTSTKETQFKRREENLRKKDLELQEALVLFNRFLKENEMKRRRAEQRANEEIKKRQQWEREIEKRQRVLEGSDEDSASG